MRFWILNIFLLFTLPALSAPLSFVYQGQIIKPDSSPLEDSSVDFTVQVLSPAPSLCVLFEETHSSVNMTGSNGMFSLPVGGGTPGAGHYGSLDDAFDNSRGTETPATCDGPNSYDANTGHTRVLRVTFNDGSGPVTVSDQAIRSVPFAQYAGRIDGLSASDLLQVNIGAPSVLSQANLEWVFQNTRYTELQALINGTSTQYMVSSPTSAVNFNGQVIDNIAAPVNADDATNKNYVDTTIGGRNADALVSAPTITQDGYVLSWNNTNNEYELIDGSSAFGDNLGNHTATANIQTGANFISRDGTASQGLSFDGSNNANFSQNLTVAQGFSVTNGINSGGNISVQTESELRMEDNAGGQYVGLKAPATVGTSYTMELPDGASPAAGRVLKSDASGNLVWATDDNTDAVTTVHGRSGAVVSANGDYTASQVTNVAAGNIAAITVQAAIDELDGEKVAKSGDLMSGNLSMDNEREVRFEENALNGDNYVALKAPALLGADLTFELPVNYGSNGDVLTSDGSGGLSWSTPAGGDVTGAANVGAGAGQIFRDETTGTLNLKTIAAGSTRLSVTNNANDVTLDVVEANINHDNLSGFVANEHVDHSGVSIATAAGTSGLSGGGDITTTRNLAIDIAGTTDVTSIQGADTLLIRDDSDAGNLKEISRTNFLSGVLTSETDPKMQTLTTGEVDQLENIDAVTITNAQWGYLGAMGGQPLESEADTLATVTGRGASTTTAITVDGSADAVQLTIQGHSTQATNVNILELENSAGTVIGSFRANGTPTAGTDLTTKSYVDGNLGGSTLNLTGLANGQSVRWNSGGSEWEVFTPAAGGEANDGANVGGGTGQIYRDKTGTNINLKTIAAGSTRLSVTNNANDVTLDVVEANINHDNLSGFVANEHVDHSGVSIATAAGTSGLSGGGDITTTRNLAIDIAGTTDVTSIQGADTLLIRDDSDAGNLKEISRTNFLSGVLTSETDPKMQTLTTGEVDQLENIDAVTITNTQWGYLGAMGGQPLESEADTLAAVTGRGASTATDITMSSEGEIRFADSVGGQYAAIKSPNDLSANYTLTLPADDGTANQVLETDGNGVLSWVTPASAGEANDGANVGGGTGQIYRDKTGSNINLKTIAAGSTRLSVTNNANDVTLDVVEANINHDNLSGFVANEHVDHSGVSIATAAGTSGLSGGGDITTTRNLAIDIAGTTDVTSIQGADTLLIRDDSDAGNLKEISRTNFLSGVLTSETDPKMQTLTTGEVDQLENIDAVTITNTQWGYLGAMGGQPLESEADTLATVTGRGASTATDITMNSSSEIRFADADSSHYVGFAAPAIVTAGTSFVWTLPVSDGSSGDVLITNGSGVLSWSTPTNGDVTGAANVGAGTGQIFRDETTGTLNLKTIAAGSTRLSVTNNANDVTLDVVEANINHDNLSGFVANEHVDHSGVSIATAAGTSGLSGGGDITTTRNLAIDIAGTTDVTSIEGADTLLIRDNSDAGNLKEISRTNFLSGVLTSETDPKVQTLTTAEVDQLETIDTVTITNTQWGYLGAMGGQPLESESDPKVQTLTTAEVDQLETIDAVTITNTQWGYLGAMGGQPLESESDPKAQTLTTAEVDQLENIDAVTITNTQWGYLGAMTAQPFDASSDVDHGAVTGLGDDDHTQYALLAGRSGGQSLIGGTAASNNLSLESTSNATKGYVLLQPNGGNVGIGTSTPALKLTVFDNQNATTGGAIVNVDAGANAEATISVESNHGNTLLGMNSTAGGGTAFLVNTANSDLSLGTNDTTRVTIQADGDVGIGTTSPNAKLAVDGAIINQDAIQDNAGAKDFSAGNIQYTTASCGAFDLHNLKSGGSYTFIVQGGTAATCSFSAYSDAGTTALTVHLPSDHGATTASTHTVYTILVAGTHAYFSWVPGL